MIVEWIRHSLTPAPLTARRMGYLRELIAIDSRRRRHRRAWAPHLRACHAVILDCSARLDRWDRVVVIGAGLSRDIPLATLALLFRQVVLVDMLFMPSVRMTALRMPAVELRPCDVTGVVEAVRTLPPGAPLPRPRATLPALEGADLVVSCNVLSQLGLLPARALSRRGGHDEEALRDLQRRLMADHLAALANAPCPACLITDIERQDMTGDRAIASRDLLLGLRPSIEGRAWWWRLAPRPEELWLHDVRHRVVGGWLRAPHQEGAATPAVIPPPVSNTDPSPHA